MAGNGAVGGVVFFPQGGVFIAVLGFRVKVYGPGKRIRKIHNKRHGKPLLKHGIKQRAFYFSGGGFDAGFNFHITYPGHQRARQIGYIIMLEPLVEQQHIKLAVLPGRNGISIALLQFAGIGYFGQFVYNIKNFAVG